jgi:hypothetical protein
MIIIMKKKRTGEEEGKNNVHTRKDKSSIHTLYSLGEQPQVTTARKKNKKIKTNQQYEYNRYHILMMIMIICNTISKCVKDARLKKKKRGNM